MKELSLHILDIVQNSIKAKAKNITVDIDEDDSADKLTITITDDGCGMSEEFLANVRDPFTTTRTTRKTGMGISLFEAAAKQTGGALDIKSKLGEGTTLTVWFGLSSIDRAPLGDMAGTMVTIIGGAPDIDYIYRHKTGKGEFILDTRELREVLGDVPFNVPDVLNWINGYIEEGLADIS
ncbi:MAG: sensor histidine kinase [Clostridia bacterium]|nr:sensor histidine kinase [Clostridia bacterium]